MREATFDVAGQDIMTADKVTLRMNAVVAYRVIDARATVSVVDDVSLALYREAPLALRAVVRARELDTFLTDKDDVASQLDDTVRARAKAGPVRVSETDRSMLIVDNATSHVEQMAPFVALVMADPEFATCLIPVGKGEFLGVKTS
jgi:regulator of protease activity HflC (stomatin/prohibitin superfamily)